MAIHLKLIKTSIVNGYTIWKDECGQIWKFPAGAGAKCNEFAGMDPLVLRARYGLPSNFYFSRHGEMDIAPDMLQCVAEEVNYG